MVTDVPTAPTRSTASAVDPIREFFTGLAQLGYVPTFESEFATLRFDVRAGTSVQRWHVTVRDGHVAVARQGGPADAVVTVDRPQLEAMVTGRLNVMVAALRGLLACEGSMAALMMFQRCLPGPPGSTGHVPPISGQTVMAQHDPERGGHRG
jgi:SCP-2 sterol transfer family